MHYKSPSRQERLARAYRKQRRTSQMDTLTRDVGSDPSESDESEFEEAPRQKNIAVAPKKSKQLLAFVSHCGSTLPLFSVGLWG